MTKIIRLFAAALFACATGSASADSYNLTTNAGIPGHNKETHTVTSAQACLSLCNGRAWCRSADYERDAKKCYLQPVNASQVSLRTNYPGNPYDHYKRQFSAQCGTRVGVEGVGAVALIKSVRQTRAERRARRAWSALVGGAEAASTLGGLIGLDFSAAQKMSPAFGLGTRYADLDKAKNVVMNCRDGAEMFCTVTATPCAW